MSSDSQVTMPVEAWQEHLPEGLREKAPRIVSTDEGDSTEFEGRRTPIKTLNNLAGKKPEDSTLNVRRLEDQRAGASDHPHSETTWPNSKALTDEWFTQYRDDDERKILCENCARVYGLV
jgi:hypothetical protein